MELFWKLKSREILKAVWNTSDQTVGADSSESSVCFYMGDSYGFSCLVRLSYLQPCALAPAGYAAGWRGALDSVVTRLK